MTSYGGATSELGSPALARWYRIPGRARTSAIGRSELDVAEVRHPAYLAQLGQHVRRDPVIHGQDHHRVAARCIATHLHACDVDVVLAQDHAKASDHAGPVLVAAYQEAAFGHKVNAKWSEAPRPRLSHQDGARQLVLADPHRDQAGVAAATWAPPLDQLHASA